MRASEEPPGPVTLEGVGASPGVAVGRAFVVQREMLILPEYRLATEAVEAEIGRLRAGVSRAGASLEAIRERAGGIEMVDAILRTQLMILEDRQLFEDAARRIREERINAEWAVGLEMRRLNALFDAMDNAVLRERRTDVNYVVRHLLLHLMGREPEGFGNLSGPAVVVANDLSPAETVQLDASRVVAIATDTGGRTSHAAIMASSLGIPAVVGLGAITRHAEDGELMIVDGRAGRVILRPDEALLQAYGERARFERRRERNLRRLADLPAETRDGRAVTLLANIERPDEVEMLAPHGARGVGLFRTEFLYLNRSSLPDEREQLRHYRTVLAGVAPGPACIRTVDLGGDKLPMADAGRGQANPALGVRGIRLARVAGHLLHTQLRAMLRASPYGWLRILLPLVTGVEEVRAVREELVGIRSDLEAEGLPVAANVELGVVVETPAAVALVDLLAPEVDFFSIGTNDLIQYTVAVDRDNEHVAYLYDPLHPAVLRAIRDVVERAHAAGRPVGVCGEMAGDPVHAWVLVGLGIDELSMNAASIPRVKEIVRQTSRAEAHALAADLLTLPTAGEVGDRLRKAMLRRFPHEFEGV